MAKSKKKQRQKEIHIVRCDGTFPCDMTFELFGQIWYGIYDVLRNAGWAVSFSPDYLSGANYSNLKYLREVYEQEKERQKRAKKSGNKCSVTDKANRVPCFDIDDFLYDHRYIHSITIRGKNGEMATIDYTDGNDQFTIHIK